MPANEKQDLIPAELVGSSTKPSPSLIHRFFPNLSHSQSILDSLGDKYGEVERRPAKGPKGRRKKVDLRRGWKGMPDPPVGNEDSIRESPITAVLVPILNSIIVELDKGDHRVAVDRQMFPIPTRDGGTLKPDIFLWGKGSPAFPPIEGTPLSKTRSKNDKDAESARHGQAVEEEGPPVLWTWCVLPIEIKTERK